jgi:hypothetical protein
MRWNCGVTEETVPFPKLRNDKAFHNRFTFENARRVKFRNGGHFKR